MKEATIRLSRGCMIVLEMGLSLILSTWWVPAKAWGLEAGYDGGGGAAMRWDGCGRLGGGGGGGGGSQMKHRCHGSNKRGICAV